MRRVDSESALHAELSAARGEAEAAFGRGEIFIEKYVSRPKHVEVQLLGDGTGNVVHLFERDCSVQRRHQKVIEYAPAVGLTQEQREQLYSYALKLGTALKLRSAATVEFLVAESGEIYFIEINPRIQVEHTVTEEITGIDLVQSQLQIAGGASLADLELRQSAIASHGVAIQCRITTENPLDNFTPDYGKLLAYRSASGFGIRLDAGSAFTGAEIMPYYDSMLVKVTSHGRKMGDAVSRMRRALSEFRIRGVSTNIAFLENLLRHSVFLSGETRTTFLDEHPEVFQIPRRRDRANRLLRFLGEVAVNKHSNMPGLAAPGLNRPSDVRFPEPSLLQVLMPDNEGGPGAPPPQGWRDELARLGRDAFLRKVREEKRLLITDTTLRDAHQSLLATRMRTYDMLPAARALAYAAPQLFSVEMWGGATFDVMLRFLREDPWERLAKLREAIPNILFQMLLRGANAVGYKSYPDNVLEAFIKEAHSAGIDIFRIFDSLNNVDRMKHAIASVKAAGGLAEASICYTGNLLSEEGRRGRKEGSKFDLPYYVRLAETLAAEGADIIAIKDMAGLLRPYSAELLVRALKAAVPLPIHLHTHDTAGVQTGAYLKASEAGVDIVDCAFAAMSGVTSQPTLEGVVAALDGTERATGFDLRTLTRFSSYWEAVRTFYRPFESDLRASTAEVYDNEIPGGQYSNFRPQAVSLGLGDRWNDLKRAYSDVNALLGNIVKVTPSSKIVGDLALFMVANNLSADDVKRRARELDFPASVIEFFRGELGVPHGGFPEPLRTDVLRGAAPVEQSVSERLAPADFEAAVRIASEAMGRPVGIRDALSYLLYPHVYKDYAEARRSYSNLMLLPTLAYFYGLREGEEIHVDIEAGKRLFISLVAISEPAENGERTVFFELNGQPRSIEIRDQSIVPETTENEQADPESPNHVGAPLSGVVVSIGVNPGDAVEADAPLFTIEAMKMQTVVKAPAAATVRRIAVQSGAKVAVGDLVVELE